MSSCKVPVGPVCAGGGGAGAGVCGKDVGTAAGSVVVAGAIEVAPGNGVGRGRATGAGMGADDGTAARSVTGGGAASVVDGGTSVRGAGVAAGTTAAAAALLEDSEAVVFGADRDRATARTTMTARTATAAMTPMTRPTPSPPDRAATGVRRVVGPGGGIVGAGRCAAGTVAVAAGIDAVGTSARPCSSARTKAPAVGHRSSGFLAMLFSSARTSGSGTVDGGGIGIGSVTCFISTATGVSAAKGTRPVSIS